MDCGTTFVKYVLFIFNTMVSVLGILAIVYGVIILETIKVPDEVGFPPQAALSFGLIAIGSIVLFISFLGCCGAIRENVCMTMCYAVVMLILLIVQMVIVVMLWVNKEQISSAMGEVVDRAWARDAGETGVFEVFQKSFKCCGANGSLDYVSIAKMFPPSCCPPDQTCLVLNNYPGCKGEFTKFVSGSTDNAKYFGIGLIAVELVGFIFACCLANNVRNNKRRNAY